jgi:flagellar motility protein MotE (MotC chaperone)
VSVTIFLSVLIIGVRLADIGHMAASGRLIEAVTPSQAATNKEMPDIQTPSLAPPAAFAAPADENGAGAAASHTAGPSLASSGPALRREDAAEESLETSLVKQLTERRDQLNQRARQLDSREALLKVAEQRVDQKIKEMETLRSQLQKMVNQVSGAQETQIENLVKIYETMKPKEAAKIFETLDLPVMLGVIQRMKPQRTSAIMAQMAPEKAKEITVALTKQDQLPQVQP